MRRRRAELRETLNGLEEALEGLSRIGMTVAGRLGEQLARAREQELRRAQAAEEQQARELQARFDAERAGSVGIGKPPKVPTMPVFDMPAAR